MSEETEYEHILVEKIPEKNYAVISINRPDKLNALQVKTVKEIYLALEDMEMDSDVRCVILRGTKDYTKKPAFSSGADLSASFGPGVKPNIPVHMAIAMQMRHRWYDLIEEFPKPLIAAVDGYALGGGCELTLVCDLVIATKRSFFGFPEINRGIFPANGGTQRMARHIGVNRVIKMIYFGERVDAETMHDWGYVSFLAEEGDEFENLVDEKATELGNSATTSLTVIKKCIKFGTQAALPVGLQYEQLGFGVNSAAGDVKEGINAFLRRKEPNYKGY
ncbi:MAG: enoyl-CoA hydratase/isomerase family protein [Promethearchaeota archaeon]|nr:MAG: enoyl-CoA hydratase/isomerase family protein [Candidatus Lokiarchaeota archaeon]